MSSRFMNQKTILIFFGILIIITVLTILDEYILNFINEHTLNNVILKINKLGFDNIYVINLDFRTDRRERMEAIANFHGLDFEFFPAVSHNDIEMLNKYPLPLSPRHKACFVSHYRVYESIVNNEYNSSLILEDDVDFEIDIESILTNEVYPYLPENWDLLYIGSCNQFNSEATEYTLYISKASACTHAYALSLSGAQKLLQYLKNTNIVAPIDLYLMYLIENGNITSYTLEPSAIVQRKSEDDPSDVSPGDYQWTYPLKNSTLHSCGYYEKITKKPITERNF